MWNSMARNDCATTVVNRKFTVTAMLCPADLTSSGKISLGTSHPSGPHDYPNPAWYTPIVQGDEPMSTSARALLTSPR